MSIERAKDHYDAVTEAWSRWIMGEELHFGLFKSGQESLEEATRELTNRMCDPITRDLDVLDVGCGIGTQSIALAKKGCRVTGVSTSPVGIEQAQKRARSLGVDARFEVRNALETGLPDASFDWIHSLESTHLIPDQPQLFREFWRLLRPGGRLALCDVVLVGTSAAEVAQYLVLGHSPRAAVAMRDAVFNTMHRAFGSSVLPRVADYRASALEAGFENIQVEDLSPGTRRTLSLWADNAAAHRDEIDGSVGPGYVDDFLLATLHMSFGWGRLGGYIFMTAEKAV